MIRHSKQKKSGYILIQVIVFGAIAAYLLGALIGWAAIDIKASNQAGNRELAMQIAEAGVDYYRCIWPTPRQTIRTVPEWPGLMSMIFWIKMIM